MAENGAYYSEFVKQERMSPVYHTGDRDAVYQNGLRGESDYSDEDDSINDIEAPIDFSLRRQQCDERPMLAQSMVTNPTQNVDSTSTSPTSITQAHEYADGRPQSSPRSLNNRVNIADVDSESSSASSSSYNLSVKEKLEALAADITTRPAQYSNTAGSRQLPAVPALTPSSVSPNSTIPSSLPPMTALYDPNRTTNGSLTADTGTIGQAHSKTTLAQDSSGIHLPLSYFGMPGFPGFHSITPGTLASINKTTEELYDMYKHQLQKIQTLEAKKRYRGLGSLSLFTAACPISPPTLSPEGSAVTTFNHQQMSPDGARHISGTVNSTGVTSSMARRRPRSLPDEQKDEAYWERRRKNNEAAKRSRDTRRAKEDEIAIRAALLEQENIRLRVELAALKTETAKLRYRVYNGN